MTIIFLLAGIVTLLLSILILLFRIHSKLSCPAAGGSRPQEPRAGNAAHQQTSGKIGVSGVSSGSAFEEFLCESPERISMNKKQQSEAYRKWRSEKGLNWK
ncbi:MAG: hypothetical protein RL346_747 [Verrucomicrobiota bacterium]|jgi:hypothetical protein